MIKRKRLSNYTVKKIIKHFCIDIDATKTSKILGFSRGTINKYFHLFRSSIYWYQNLQFEKFVGHVELDESYFGAKRKRGFHGKLKRGRGTLKQPVFGVFKRDGKVYTEIIPDCKKATLLPIIQGKVDIKSIMYTDSWKAYDGLVAVGYDKHYRVNHGKNEFALKGEDGATVTVNGIESFWSFTKRRLAKFNGSKVYFELHLKESEWRWRRNELDLEKELWDILKQYLKHLSQIEIKS
jgi:transposase